MIQYDRFCIDGLAYQDLPSSISKVMDTFGVVSDDYQAFSNTKVSIGVVSPNDDNTYSYVQRNPNQAYAVGWDGSGAKITHPLYMHLKQLYENQSTFWLQFDNEMSREFGKIVLGGTQFKNIDKQKVFVIPNYPVVPYGNTDDDPVEWAQTDLLINNKYTNLRFTVDNDNGLVTFNNIGYIIDERTDVKLRYTWRMLVRIRQFDVSVQNIAQTYYAGTVVFEQVRGVTKPVCTWSDYVG